MLYFLQLSLPEYHIWVPVKEIVQKKRTASNTTLVHRSILTSQPHFIMKVYEASPRQWESSLKLPKGLALLTWIPHFRCGTIVWFMDVRRKKKMRSGSPWILQTLLARKLTVPETAKPFVHLIRIPESIEVCFTGKENVNPISLVLPGWRLNFPASFCANLASPEAMKSKSS